MGGEGSKIGRLGLTAGCLPWEEGASDLRKPARRQHKYASRWPYAVAGVTPRPALVAARRGVSTPIRLLPLVPPRQVYPNLEVQGGVWQTMRL